MLAVVVNLATDLKDNWLAWIGVVVLAALAGVVGALVQHMMTPSSNGASPPTPSTVAEQYNESVNFSSGRVRGDVHIHQAGKRTFVIETAILSVAAILVTLLVSTGKEPVTTGTAAAAAPMSQSTTVVTASTTATPPAASAPPSAGPLQVAESWPLSRGSPTEPARAGTFFNCSSR